MFKVMRRELAPQKGWCCYTFGFHDVIILSYLLKYISYPHILGIICDLASQNQQKVAWPSFVLWLEIGDQGLYG